MKITKKQLRRIIREQIEDGLTIAGRKVKYATKEDVLAKVSMLKRKLIGKEYADTHSVWSAEDHETPEETVGRFIQWTSGDFPGGVTIYQDPNTGEIFGHARYNTF